MQNMFLETQFKIIGKSGKHATLLWRNTPQDAVDMGLTFEQAWIWRPDGTLLCILGGETQW